MTGLSPERDEIVEVALVLRDPGCSEVRAWSRVVRATVETSPEAHKIHGISRSEIDRGEAPSVAIGAFLDAIEGRVLIGHSPSLDLQFLHHFVMSHMPERLAPAFALDTLVLARRALRADRYTLESLCRSLEIVLSHAHRAESDARATASLFEKLAPMFAPRDARDLWEVRVGQHREIRVRTAIAARIERALADSERVQLVVRQGGSAPRTIRGVVEHWEPPHVRVRRANATPVLLRADRILRIEPCAPERDH
ncbi:MAG: 3'-5' exonuclease [Myxococcales bacterium]|nr:3'-5' exonuclease [Myxococcales bacterium]